MAPDEFVARCCSILDVSFEVLTGRRKGRNISRMRYLIAALAIERWELTAKQLGELLGRLPEAVSRWASRGSEIRLSSRDFLQEYEALDQTLAGQGRKSEPIGKER
jgi:chromosomal replication initiation ATPase DnaA